MKIKTFRTACGWWVVMVWDPARGVSGDWSLWWSGSKKKTDMEQVINDLKKHSADGLEVVIA